MPIVHLPFETVRVAVSPATNEAVVNFGNHLHARVAGEPFGPTQSMSFGAAIQTLHELVDANRFPEGIALLLETGVGSTSMTWIMLLIWGPRLRSLSVNFAAPESLALEKAFSLFTEGTGKTCYRHACHPLALTVVRGMGSTFVTGLMMLGILSNDRTVSLTYHNGAECTLPVAYPNLKRLAFSDLPIMALALVRQTLMLADRVNRGPLDALEVACRCAPTPLLMEHMIRVPKGLVGSATRVRLVNACVRTASEVVIDALALHEMSLAKGFQARRVDVVAGDKAQPSTQYRDAAECGPVRSVAVDLTQSMLTTDLVVPATVDVVWLTGGEPRNHASVARRVMDRNPSVLMVYAGKAAIFEECRAYASRLFLRSRSPSTCMRAVYLSRSGVQPHGSVRQSVAGVMMAAHRLGMAVANVVAARIIVHAVLLRHDIRNARARQAGSDPASGSSSEEEDPEP